jgi:methylenetetrahydrofolate reductase (NADPH)
MNHAPPPVDAARPTLQRWLTGPRVAGLPVPDALTPPLLSFEFFPPKTEALEQQLWACIRRLEPLQPRFVSVTYGAGGSTQERTHETVARLVRETSLTPAAHLTCVGASRAEVDEVARRYWDAGIRHIVALRGDLPSGMMSAGEFRHASDLVAFIRAETGDHFFIEVAAYPEVHPQARNAQDALKHFKIKVDAGADSAITQYFYNADAYFHFVDDCEAAGIDLPIVPGIMPINNFSQLCRFSDACGAEIPRWIRSTMQGFGDDSASIKAFGLDVVTSLCDRLLSAGAPGLHFYTMNSAGLVSTVWQRLGLS